MNLNEISIKDLKTVCDFLNMKFDEVTIETDDWSFDIIVKDNTGKHFTYNSLDKDHLDIFIEHDPIGYDSYSLKAILEVQNKKINKPNKTKESRLDPTFWDEYKNDVSEIERENKMTENLENLNKNIIEHFRNNPHHALIFEELQERANLSNAEMDVLLRFCINIGGEIFAKEFKSMIDTFYDLRRN